MKTLVLMRHGKAMPPAQDLQDEDRTLTTSGAEALAARLPHMLRMLEPHDKGHIWTSPARRARQTAELLQAALKKMHVSLEEGIEEHGCLWEQDLDGFITKLYGSSANLVFVVGHAPFVEDVVVELAGSTPTFKPGALCCLEVSTAKAGTDSASRTKGAARLQWFVQGPDTTRWLTLANLQSTLVQGAEEVERRREVFLENPDDPKTIHRFRTGIRSLRSQLAFIKPWQRSKQNAEAQTILRDIVRHTTLLRELDVFERQARSNPSSSPELLELCRQTASDERARVLKALSSKRVTRSFERAMDLAKHIAWKKHCARHGLPEAVVSERFDSLVESVQADLATLQLCDDERTHDVRKRAKQARYVSEANVSLLGADAVGIATGITAHHDTLGDVCDARANIRLINGFLQQDLPKVAVCELNLMRAQNETFLYSALRQSMADQTAD